MAGKLKGAADDRYLWPAMLDIIRQVRPTWIIGENVIGIASMVLPGAVTKVEDETALQFEDHRVIETEEERFVIDQICEDLEQAGYSVQPLVIPACSIGAPTTETECGSLHDLIKLELLPTPVASDATMGAVIGKENTFRIISVR